MLEQLGFHPTDPLFIFEKARHEDRAKIFSGYMVCCVRKGHDHGEQTTVPMHAGAHMKMKFEQEEMNPLLGATRTPILTMLHAFLTMRNSFVSTCCVHGLLQ